MNSIPELSTVYQAVSTLNHNPNCDEKAKASSWLEELQKSVFAWKISDEMLREKKDLESCCFAAQTMRRKIQYHFLELPTDAHESLKNSLMEHISQIDEYTNHAIVTQLCLALADLALQMFFWQEPVVELINRFGGNSNTLWSLLEIMKVLPEEAKTLRLGANRREEVLRNLSACADTVTEFLELCLKNNEKKEKVHVRILSCLTSWIAIEVIPIEKIPTNLVVVYAFQILRNNMAYPQLHETATDCVLAILQNIEIENKYCKEPSIQLEQLELCIFTRIITLEEPYHFSVAHEEIELSLNYCRIFTELGETFRKTIIKGCAENKQHYGIKILDMVLMCVSHYDWEVAQITFNFWYQLSEELYQRNNNDLIDIFRPFIERLIESLCKHCQMEPDHLGLVEEGGAEFIQFRNRVSDLIKDVIFILGSSHCFHRMFLKLTGAVESDNENVIHQQQQQQPTWDVIEAALFVMQSVAKNIPEENKIVPSVVEAILNIRDNTHIAVRYTSIILLGELCEWVNGHPESLEPILNFLLMCLNENGLASAACGALNNICKACPEHMSNHFDGLLKIARCLDSFPISNEAAIGLLKGISIILGRLSYNEIVNGSKELCWYQAKPLCHLIESNNSDIIKGSKNDPVYWLDRLTAIFRHINPRIDKTNVHPCRDIVTEIWPVFTNVCNKYLNDPWVMERTCRCMRYSIRCISKDGVHLLETIVKQIVQLYSINTFSCFLYLGSILVDEYANGHDCADGFIQMLEAFITPTFKILQEPDGLKNHPDTVDDLFRLCTRFLQKIPVEFLHSIVVNSIIDCALMACSLEHKEANASVMKFFYDLVHCGRINNDRSDFTIRQQLIKNILQQKGQSLVTNLLHASVYALTSTMLPDVAEVFIELTLTDQSLMAVWLAEAIKTMPAKNVSGSPTATQDQLQEFHITILRTTESSKAVTHALKNFARLFR